MSVPVAYRRLLAVLCVIGFHANVLNYLFLTGFTLIPPAVSVVVLVVLIAPFAFERKTSALVLANPVLLWCGLYAAMTGLWFMGSSQSAAVTNEMWTRLGSVLFLISLLVLFADERTQRTTQIALLASGLLGVVLNVIDILRPLSISPTIGRAAGLYINPNLSAFSLTLAMILSADLVRSSLRPWYVALIGVGVLLTFSRGGMAIWLVGAVLLLVQGALRWRTIARTLLTTALVVGVTLLFSDTVQRVVATTSGVWGDVWTQMRLTPGIEDYSRGIRQQGSSMAWQLFTQRPIAGNGVGATVEWELSESTHNIYLRHLAEYGIAGALIMPLLIVLLIWGIPPGNRDRAVRLALVGLIWGILSHNILDDRQFLLAVAFSAAVPYMPRRSTTLPSA